MICPKCGFEQEDGRDECTKCMVVFSKFEALQKRREQSNVRYSPQAEGGDGERETLAVDATDSLDAFAEAVSSVSPGVLSDLQQRIRKVQEGMDALAKAQESQAAEAGRQKSRLRDLFSLFTVLRDTVDQQVLQIQGAIQPMAEALRGCQASMTENADFRMLREQVRALSEGMDALLPIRKVAGTVERLAPKLEHLEAVHRELKDLLKRGGGPVNEASASDLVFIRMELHALRSEVRNLMDQSMRDPSVRESSPDAGPDREMPGFDGLARIPELEGRVRELGTRLEAMSSEKDRDSANLAGQFAALVQKMKGFDDAFARMSSRVEADDGLRGNLDALAMDIAAARDELVKTREQSCRMDGEVRQIHEHLRSIQDLLGRIKSAWTMPAAKEAGPVKDEYHKRKS